MIETAAEISEYPAGRQIGRYRIEQELGRGAHGMVYLGHHRDTPHERVAVKVIEEGVSSGNLLLEAQLLARLRHPNIVRLLDHFLHNGRPVLVMEHLEGEDLDAHLAQRGRLTGSEVRELLKQISSALSEAHGKDVIHSDIKLSNIMVTGDTNGRRFVLTDFGVSRMAGGIQFRKRVNGTYRFMAPEQIRGRAAKESDYWSLGVTAYRLLTGEMPFRGESVEQLRHSIFFGKPPAPCTLAGDVPDDVNHVVQRLLDTDLMSRLHDNRELLGLLESDGSSTPSADLYDTYEEHDSERPDTWRENTEQQIRRAWGMFWGMATLAALPNLVVGPALIIVGMHAFYSAQAKAMSKWRVVSSMALILAGWVTTSATHYVWMLLTSGSDGVLINTRSSIAGIAILVFTLIAANRFARIRELERNLVTMRVLRSVDQSRDQRKGAIKDYLTVHLGDLNIHCKYVEELLAAGQLKEAVVEAKIIRGIDRYNFGANLLLADAYYQAGLLTECEEVCNDYLAASGQCFEFAELANRCRPNPRDSR